MRSSSAPFWLYRISRGLFFLLLAYLGVISLFYALQRRLTYFPDPRPVTPAESGLNPRQVLPIQITAEGAHLQGWWCSADSSKFAQSRRTVILFPGNAGNRGDRAPLIEQWNDLGCDVVIFDYRGYGGSSGRPSEAAIAQDAVCIWEYVSQERNVPADQIVLCGQSLGGAVATRLAWDLDQSNVVPGGLVLRCSFTSLADAGAYHYPWLPVRFLLIDQYPSINRIPDVKCPLLMMHGQRDRIVPFQHGEKLFAAARQQSDSGIQKRFLSLPRAGHNDMMHTHAREITDSLSKFLAELQQQSSNSK